MVMVVPMCISVMLGIDDLLIGADSADFGDRANCGGIYCVYGGRGTEGILDLNLTDTTQGLL